MNENKIITKNLRNVPIGELANYTISCLYQLHEEAKTHCEEARTLKEWIESAINLKYEEKVKAKRLRVAKDTGVIHLEDNGFKVSCDIAKKVEWDQGKLSAIAANIIASGGDIAEYIEVHYNVSERTYSSWSETLRNIFAPARTVRLCKPVYKLVKLDQEAGL